MIRLYRKGVRQPGTWKTTISRSLPSVADYDREAERFESLPLNSEKRRAGFARFASHVLVLAKGKASFPSCWSIAKDVLAEMSHYKCSYCEGEINSPRAGQVEHFKPKSLFPSLAYVWANYFLACGGCNGAKGDKWPVKGSYLRPDQGDPASCLLFITDGTVQARRSNIAAQRTIEDFDLNRTWLVRRRKLHIQQMLNRLELTAAVKSENESMGRRLENNQRQELKDPELAYSAALKQCFSNALKHP